MLPHFVQEKSRSTKVVEEDDGLKKIECLRGRLLAERQASRIAKENAQSISNKLIELEKQLKEETKLRNRAEKKLKFLKQKLESKQVVVSSPEFEQSSSVSENSLGSCELSTLKSNSVPKDYDPEEEHRHLLQSESSITPIVENNVVAAETRKSDQTHDVKSTNDSLDSQTRALSSENSVENRPQGDENVKTDEPSCSSGVVSEDHDDVDNSLALVPITMPGREKTKELVVSDQSVAEVLEALRHARERIEHTLRQRRHLIKVGPTPTPTPTQPQIC